MDPTFIGTAQDWHFLDILLSDKLSFDYVPVFPTGINMSHSKVAGQTLRSHAARRQVFMLMPSSLQWWKRSRWLWWGVVGLHRHVQFQLEDKPPRGEDVRQKSFQEVDRQDQVQAAATPPRTAAKVRMMIVEDQEAIQRMKKGRLEKGLLGKVSKRKRMKSQPPPVWLTHLLLVFHSLIPRGAPQRRCLVRSWQSTEEEGTSASTTLRRACCGFGIVQ